MVKQRRRRGAAGVLLAIVGVGLCASLFEGCGGAPPPPPRSPGYGARVAACIDAPRPLNDAAQERMITVPAGLAVQGSLAKERAQARVDFGPGGERLVENEAPVRRAYVAGTPWLGKADTLVVKGNGWVAVAGTAVGPRADRSQRRSRT